jgi:hypothetical protein
MTRQDSILRIIALQAPLMAAKPGFRPHKALSARTKPSRTKSPTEPGPSDPHSNNIVRFGKLNFLDPKAGEGINTEDPSTAPASIDTGAQPSVSTDVDARQLTELVIGRLALCGFCSGVLVSLLTGKTILDQAALWPDNVVLIGLAVLSSCLTVNTQNGSVVVRFLPLFSSMKLERRLGRTAVIGFSAAMLFEALAMCVSKFLS